MQCSRIRGNNSYRSKRKKSKSIEYQKDSTPHTLTDVMADVKSRSIIDSVVPGKKPASKAWKSGAKIGGVIYTSSVFSKSKLKSLDKIVLD